MIAKTTSTTRVVHRWISKVAHDAFPLSTSSTTASRSIHSLYLCHGVHSRRCYSFRAPQLERPPWLKSEKEYQGLKRLLTPYALSGRLRGLAERGQLSNAVEMVQNAPMDACNVSVWNTIIFLCMKASRFKLAYKLYTDVRLKAFLSQWSRI
jgi:hypothetical protein